ncbi:siderophore-interacting protein [Bradyrhizobium manausense]|uniref:siderophore-interacting protein n=1 Tax=Bradyrhizobium manausense TaxID=989370 RepID=UPI001BA7DF70|nr:siderophore-interacting protein [Bradyrhizobium manausense]
MNDVEGFADGAEHRVQPGRVERTLVRLFARKSTIDTIETLSPRFRLISFRGETLQGVTWSPGQKIQISIRGFRTARTYTPTQWDSERGIASVLVWSHGSAPGSDWARNAEPGDECLFFGPRRSVESRYSGGRLVIFGDETTFGLACALQAVDRTRPLHLVFEVLNAKECRTVLHRMALDADLLVERMRDEGHLTQCEQSLARFAGMDATFILAGRAHAIQRISRCVKWLGVDSSRLRVKAFWTRGKTGLD